MLSGGSFDSSVYVSRTLKGQSGVSICDDLEEARAGLKRHGERGREGGRSALMASYCHVDPT